MSRRTICIAIAFCLVLLSLTGCAGGKGGDPEPTAENTTVAGLDDEGRTKTDKSDVFAEPAFSDAAANALNSLRQSIFDDGSVCGICYLGGVDKSGGPVKNDPAYVSFLLQDTGLASEWPFLTELGAAQLAETELGQELYLIVPVSDDCSVSVNRWIMNEENGFVGETGEVLYRSEAGTPVLLVCNYSDVFPDVQVNVVGGGKTATFEPMLSLRDGSITMPFNVPLTDLTPYPPESDAPLPPEGALDAHFGAQLKLIENSRETWAVPESEREGLPVYTVTDLDDNGRLELISTYSHGTGQYTTSCIYEVSPDFSVLEKCRYDPSTMSSEPELGVMSWAYYLDGSGARAYIVNDYLREGYEVSHTYKYAMWFRDGRASVRLLGWVDMFADTSDPDGLGLKYDYYDANENAITALEYDRLADVYFDALQPSFIQLDWFDLTEDGPLYDKLVNALNTFQRTQGQG